MLTIENIAKICHENNRAFCQSIGDDSQPSWEDAPQWMKDSAMDGVRLHLWQDVGPEASHNAWMAHKVKTGWTYGPVKDPMAKEHPCLVPFEQLSTNDQSKDYIFRAVVHACREFAEDFLAMR